MKTEEAKALGGTEWWKHATPEEIVGFQLYEDKLCMDFGDFQQAVETVLNRPVWTHEFAWPDNLRKELQGGPRPSMQEIMELIPEEKRIILEL